MFSETKFRNQTIIQQEKAIVKLLRKIETDLSDPQKLKEHLAEITFLRSLFSTNLNQILADCLDKLSAETDPHQILQLIAKYLNARGETRTDTQIHVRKQDGARQKDPSLLEKTSNIILVLDNLRSVFNVGSIFRTAECLAIKELILCGITPTPQHPNMAKTAMGTQELVKWSHLDKTIEAIEKMKIAGYKIIALETVENSQSVLSQHFDYPLALVVGNEALGISEDVLRSCDDYCHIPVLGEKNSLNVAVSTAVALYCLMMQ